MFACVSSLLSNSRKVIPALFLAMNGLLITSFAAAQVTFSKTSLSFGTQAEGTSSASQSLTMTNSGTATLSITSIKVTGTDASSFGSTNTCGTSLGAGAKCSTEADFAPKATGALTAAITITDSATGSPQSIGLSGTGIPLTTLTLPPGGSLPAATDNVAYSGAIDASGGSGSGYVFTVNGTSIPTTGTAVLIADGISVSSTGTGVLHISGTPTAVGTVTLASVTVKDNVGHTAGPDTYTIAVQAGYAVSGQINLNNYCGGTLTLPPFKVSINTTPVETTTTNSSGNYTFASVPNGTYTITPSISGPSSAFFPATQSGVVVNSGPATVKTISAALGYTISGTVSYSGTKTGRIYVALGNNSCGTPVGTSIAAPGSFTIRGAAPGSYTLSSWMDNRGYGVQNASNPTSETSSLVVSDANLSAVAVALNDPAVVTLSTGPTLNEVSGFEDGAIVQFHAIKKNGVELPTSYTIEWSTSASFASVTGSETFAAAGDNPWIVTGIANGSGYYFRARGVVGTSTSNWSAVAGPVTVGIPTGADTLTGKVTFSQTAKGPLYVGVYDQNTNKIYATVVGSKASPPTSPASYAVDVPSSSHYFFFAFLDQNNDGLIDSGDITNVNGYNMITPTLVVSGNTTKNLTLASGNSVAVVRSGNDVGLSEWGGSSQGYELDFDVTGVAKQPVAVTVTSGPNIAAPLDAERCNGCGYDVNSSYSFEFRFSSIAPTVGATYGMQVTYSDGTQETFSPKITAVLPPPENISPEGPVSSTNTKPTLTWTYPSNASDYLYQMWFADPNYNTVWSIPSLYSNTNSFTSSIAPSISWGTDPTGATGNPPALASLTDGAVYHWEIVAYDANGNRAENLVDFVPGFTPLSLPAASPGTPGPARQSQGYSGSISATGGYGGYSYAINGINNCYGCSGISLGDGLTVTNAQNTLNIGGTPTGTGRVSFEVYVRDASSDAPVGPVTYTINVTAGDGLSLPAPNPSSLGPTVVDLAYNGSVSATGGAVPYSWNVTNLSDNLGWYTGADNATLIIYGTPSSTGTVTFQATVRDSAGESYGPVTYTIAVKPAVSNTYPVRGYVFPNGCNDGNSPPIKLTISGAGITTQTTFSDGNGQFQFPSIPDGTYTVTPSITGPASSAFNPVSQTVTVAGSGVNLNNFTAYLGYTVSGQVGYSGADTGRVYISLSPTVCGSNTPGTSIGAPGPFTIRGVPPGIYTVNAWMDNLHRGVRNASNPAGSASNVLLTSANVGGLSVEMANPSAVTLSSAPIWSGTQGTGAFSGGAFVSFGTIRNSSNGIEIPTSYTLEWSTSSSFSSITGSKSFPATSTVSPRYWDQEGTDAYSFDPWVVTGLANGDTYYFRAAGVVGSGSSAITGPWSAPSSGVTIGAPSTGNAVSGTVTFSQTATGPLYVGFYNQATGRIYADVIASPKSPQSYSVGVPTGSDYFFFAFIDQNNDGAIDPGDISNTAGYNMITPLVAIDGATTGKDLTLSSASSEALAITENNVAANLSDSSFSRSYALDLMVSPVNKLPVAVALTSGANVLAPVDIAMQQGGGYSPNSRFWAPSIELNPAVAPTVGDAYGLQITYSDGTSETLNPKITAVLPDVATDLSPAGPLTAIDTKPTLTWDYPETGAANYFYQLWFADERNFATAWSIPNLISAANGFTSNIKSIAWGTDPTDPSNPPTVASLTKGDLYYWELVAYDANGNRGQASVSFVPGYTALALPAPNPSSLGHAVSGQPYSGSIAPSGGYRDFGGGYSYSVNCSACWGDPSVPLGYGLTANGEYGLPALTITGTPTATGQVSFTVYAQDASGATVGPVTYTIIITNAPVSLPAASSDPLGAPVAGIPYGGTIDAAGGVGGNNYSFTVNGVSIPTSMTYVAVTGSDGLKFANSGDNTLWVGGTPASSGTFPIDVTVTDTTDTSNKASVTYSLVVNGEPNGVNNGNAKGTYVCKANGFKDSDRAAWATVSSVVLDGKGNITSGIFDYVTSDGTTATAGTITGTYSIGPDNNGLSSTKTVFTSGATGTVSQTWMLALTNAGEPSSPAQEFRMVEADDLGATPSGKTGTADCYLANSAAFGVGTISDHGFAFAEQGTNSSGIPKEYAGRFTTSAATGSGTSAKGTIGTGIMDGMRLDQTGDNGGAFTGTYTGPNSNGRFTITTTPSGSTAAFTAAAYIIDANRMFLLEIAGDTGVLSGDMRTQQQATYSGSSADGAAVLYGQGFEYSNSSISGYDSSIYRVSGNGAGDLTVRQSYDNVDGNYTAGKENNSAVTVTFDSSHPGRATFAPGSDSAFLYFYNTNSAFYLDLNGGGTPNFLEAGMLEPQTQTTFTDAALAGTYMYADSQLQPGNNTVGEIDLVSTGSVTANLSKGGEDFFAFDQLQTGFTYSWLTATYGAIELEQQATCMVVTPTNLICMNDTSPSAKMSILQQ